MLPTALVLMGKRMENTRITRHDQADRIIKSAGQTLGTDIRFEFKKGYGLFDSDLIFFADGWDII